MKNVIKYIILSLIVTTMIIVSLTNIEALNYTWTWGGNRASWTYSDSGYVYPSHKIKLKSGDSLYYNGVTVTSGTGGGGIAASDNTTFTGINTFTDSLRANGYSLIDDAKITSYLRVTGEVTTDLNFNKGSLAKIGTISTDSLAFITDNTQRMVITKDGKILFLDSVRVSNAIAIFDSAKIGVDVSMLSDSSGINWTSGGLSQIYQLPSPASILAFKQNEFDFFTKKGNQILYLDSLNGMTLNYGVYTGNGSGLTSIDAITLKGQDTTHFARTDTLTTETNKSQNIFSDIATFWKTVTFTVSPVFSALVNFANGINVTGNATISGNVTADTLKGKGQKITGIKRTIVLPTSQIFSPADATTYYGGSYIGGFETTEITCRVYVGMTDTIRAVYMGVYKGAAGTTENVAYYVRVNGATDYTITTTGQLTSGFGVDVISNTAMAVPLAAGDYFTIKMVCPTWATNPTNLRTSTTILMD